MLIYSCLHNLETCKNCKGLYSHFTLSLHFFFTVVSPIGQFLKTKNHIFVLPRQETILHRKVPTCEHLFLVQIFDFWDIFWDTFYEKPLTERSVRGFSGESEIRTRDTLLGYTRFPGVPLQPLEHLSNTYPGPFGQNRTAKVIIFSGSASTGGSIFPRGAIKSGCGRCNRGILRGNG